MSLQLMYLLSHKISSYDAAQTRHPGGGEGEKLCAHMQL